MNRLALSLSLFALSLPGVAACGPKTSSAVDVAATVAAPPRDPNAWRATTPAPGLEKPYQPPAATRFVLSNGVPVFLVQQGDLPLVSVRLWMGVGREANPPGKAGLIAMTATMLDEGTKTRDSAAIAGDAALLGAELSISAGDESTVVALDALTGSTLGPSLDLMADVVLRPKLDKKDFARMQGDTLAAIQAASAEPNDTARRVFLGQLFGADHPYGTPGVGTTTSVTALRLADIKKAYAEYWHSGNAAFVVVGKVDEATAKAELESRFGSWKAGKSKRAEVAPPVAPMKLRVVFREQAGSVQSVVRVGTLAPSRTGDGYWREQVAVTLFGGMFSSRLNMALREEKGWSYGAYAGNSDSRDHGIFQARTSVQADKTAESLQVILDELAAQANRAPTDAELKLTRDSLTKSLPGNFESNAATAGAFLQLPGFGMPVDTWRSYSAHVNGVAIDAVAAASKQRLDTTHMLAVVVGPRTIEVDDGKGVKTTVDVVASLKAMGHEFVEVK